MSSNKKGSRWSRSDILACCALVVSLFALAVPFGIQIYDQINAPSAQVNGLEDRTSTSGPDIEVRVSYANRADDSDIWLVLKPGIEGKYYPWTRIVPEQGDLNQGESGAIDVFLGTPGPYQLLVYSATPSQGQAFQEYLSLPAPERTGMFGLPEGIVLLTTAELTRSE